MVLFTFLLVIVVILSVVGLGWKTFSSGVLIGIDIAVDIGTPVIKNHTQEARDYMNSPEQLRPT
ncbi:MAG: hypothetical protein ACRD8W_21565 [Nitrososphaeraceae archaeon]